VPPTTSSLETGEGLFWFRRFINMSLTYLLRHLLTYGAEPTRGVYWRKWQWCRTDKTIIPVVADTRASETVQLKQLLPTGDDGRNTERSICAGLWPTLYTASEARNRSIVQSAADVVNTGSGCREDGSTVDSLLLVSSASIKLIFSCICFSSASTAQEHTAMSGVFLLTVRRQRCR